jgi:leader peptidase (prepilin peptidase)/N-methyltransferase
VSVLGPVLCGLLGVWVGVFVDLLIDRVPDKRPELPLHIRCRGCRDEDEKPDLAPVPWLLRGRRCPRCQRLVTARYAVVELTAGGLFAGAAIRFGADAVLPAYLVFFAALLAMSVIDLDQRIIPNRIVYPTVFVSIPLLALAAAVDGEFDRLGTALLGAALAWAAMFALHLVYPAGMGFGDVRLSFVLGLFLGWLSLSHVLIGIFLGFLLGAVLGVLLIVVGIKSRKDAVPFGPFLAGGAVICILVGNPIVDWWTMSGT